MLSKKCLFCSNIFYKPPSDSLSVWETSHKYCSVVCKQKDSRGKPSPNKGKKYPQISGDKHYCWKGDKVGYFALHGWVVKNLGKPTICEKCGRDDPSPRVMQWANKSGTYKRELTDWMRLCIWCHGKADDTFFKKGFTPWNKGKKNIYSEETRRKMGAGNLGKIPWNKKVS